MDQCITVQCLNFPARRVLCEALIHFAGFGFVYSAYYISAGFEEVNMGSLQGPVMCPTVRAKQVGFYTLPMIGPLTKARLLRSEFWGFKKISYSKNKMGILSPQLQKCSRVHCSFGSSSDGNGSPVENFNEKDDDYVNSSVIEAGKLSRLLYI